MTPRLLIRSLTPLGWAAAVVVLLAVLVFAGRGLGLHWDPFGLEARRLAAAHRNAEAASADAFARRLESDGEAVRSVRREHDHQLAIGLARATAAAEAQARNAHDSQITLDADRADRLRAHDSELCRFAPDVCDAAPVEPVVDGLVSMSAGSPAARADNR